MAGKTSRVVQWVEREVRVNEIPIEGTEKWEQQCDGSFALVYAGHGRTGAGGSWTVSLPAISCYPPGPGGDRQPSVTATPTTDGFTDDVPVPYILVVRTAGPNVTVWSYDVGGKLAPDVEFSWHCIVEGTLVG